MLRRKARPKRDKSKSLLDCKGVGDLYRIYHDIVCSNSGFSKFGQVLGKCIPVLSIFAFLGMITYAITIISFDSSSEEVSAVSYATPTSALIISNNSTSTETTRGQVTYSSHNVKVEANNIDGYSLTITGPTNMTNDGTTIGSVGTNILGSSIGDNTWGYAWGSTGTTDASLRYNGFTGSAQTLDDNSTTAISNNKIDFTKKLVFGVKFNDSAANGHYKANVILNLALTPQKLTAQWSTGVDSGIFTMQEMTPSICTQVTTPIDTNIPKLKLEDSRDGKEYTIARLKDGNCWMIDNLVLDLSIVGIASTTKSDNLSTDFPTKSLEMTDWLTSNSGNIAAQFRKNPAVGSTDTGDGGGYRDVYGYYYSWCAATADTCSNATSANIDAPGSICPKGWHLPKGGNNVSTTPNRYAADITTMTNSDIFYLRNNDANLTGNKSSPWSSYFITIDGVRAFILGGASWYLAGEIYNNGILLHPGYTVNYWTRTGGGGDYYTYTLDMASDRTIYPSNPTYRYVGASIRCIAYSS